MVIHLFLASQDAQEVMLVTESVSHHDGLADFTEVTLVSEDAFYLPIYWKYIGTGYKYIFWKYMGNISGLAAIAWQFKF